MGTIKVYSCFFLFFFYLIDFGVIALIQLFVCTYMKGKNISRILQPITSSVLNIAQICREHGTGCPVESVGYMSTECIYIGHHFFVS